MCSRSKMYNELTAPNTECVSVCSIVFVVKFCRKTLFVSSYVLIVREWHELCQMANFSYLPFFSHVFHRSFSEPIKHIRILNNNRERKRAFSKAGPTTIIISLCIYYIRKESRMTVLSTHHIFRSGIPTVPSIVDARNAKRMETRVNSFRKHLTRRDASHAHTPQQRQQHNTMATTTMVIIKRKKRRKKTNKMNERRNHCSPRRQMCTRMWSFEVDVVFRCSCSFEPFASFLLATPLLSIATCFL